MVKINKNIFRGYDIRGVYPKDFNSKVAVKIMLAFADLYPEAKTIVIAHDTRKSSPILARAISKALAREGREIIFLGTAPDPLFYFCLFHYGYDAGVVVSGSHNPKEYNGLTSIFVKGKGDLVLEDLEAVKELALKERQAKIKKQGKIIKFNPEKDYITHIISKISFKRPLKVLIDSGNGAMGYLPEKVFKRLGCQVETIYGEFDGNFPNHSPDPYEKENRLDAEKAVLKGKFDIGFVYDGDGDRVATIDNLGRSVSGDFCLLMLTRQALEKHHGPIVYDARVSKTLLDEMKQRNVKTYFSVSHHSAVIKKIIETKAVFGGEVTLHFLFPKDYYLCDEALFASLKLAEIASAQKDFASYVDSLPRYLVSPEVFIPCADEKKFKVIANLQEILKKKKYDFIDIDGARINFPHGWALCRAANSTPLIKIRFEADTEKHLIEIQKEALKLFKQAGVPVSKSVYRKLGLK
ncbi:phosphomannomutase/phosphoglucomutase [Candidatus Parcubacteria bacterium]|nr:phosphomannomutase/phosphoglucomutase [Patescibacteria group bacterium]MCG2688599.1 phosphomannomutase/phosphoglucomutase [Candidatus Parcubacteria bacterium]